MANDFRWLSCLLQLIKALMILWVCCLVAACSLFQGQPGTHPVAIGPGSPLTGGSSLANTSDQASGYGWLLPAGSYHMVTMRSLPTKSEDQQILCTEPSPDWAVAFGEALQLSAEGKAPSGVGASLSGSSSDTESVTALVGRTAGVVALRDGLYSACQAYANHIIGKDAYGLIISQYGDLLLALAGTPSGGGAGAAGSSSGPTTTPTTPAGLAVAVSAGSVNGTGSAATVAKSTSSSNDTSQVALLQQEALQALVTVCITNADPTERSIPSSTQGTSNSPNVLLTSSSSDPNGGGDYCHQLIEEVVKAAPELLKPQANSSGKDTNGSGSTPKFDPKVQALQEKLINNGYKIVSDGIMGPGTEAAIADYIAKHAGASP